MDFSEPSLEVVQPKYEDHLGSGEFEDHFVHHDSDDEYHSTDAAEDNNARRAMAAANSDRFFLSIKSPTLPFWEHSNFLSESYSYTM